MKLNENAIEKIKYEIVQLDKLLESSESLFKLIKLDEPDFIEKSAAALIIHSFYNGIENILQIIQKETEDEISGKDMWHRFLLNNSFNKTGKRDAIFRLSLKDSLNEYLAFRHFIRHSYGFEIVWEKMKPLFNDLMVTWEKVKEDIRLFLISA